VIVYLDTSAAMKLVVEEAESAALADHLEQVRADRTDVLVSSLLLHAELHCAAGRHPEAVGSDEVTAALSTVSLVDLERGDLLTAPLLPGRLRAADALHLATALRVGSGAMVTYDAELSTAATAAALRVIAPA